MSRATTTAIEEVKGQQANTVPEEKKNGSDTTARRTDSLKATDFNFRLLEVSQREDQVLIAPFLEAYYKTKASKELPMESKAEMISLLSSNSLRAVGVFEEGFLVGCVVFSVSANGDLVWKLTQKSPSVQDACLKYGMLLDNWLHEKFKTRRHFHVVGNKLARLMIEAGMGEIADFSTVTRNFDEAR